MFVASGANDGAVHVWNTVDGKVETKLKRGGHTGPVNACAWNARGHDLVSVSKDTTVVFWAP